MAATTWAMKALQLSTILKDLYAEHEACRLVIKSKSVASRAEEDYTVRYLCMSVCVCVCVCVCVSVGAYANGGQKPTSDIFLNCALICLSVCLSMSICSFIYLSVCLSVYLSI